ncbi:helix-turn-helix domain-containing protein [Streptomyces bauhiniae]|uniref:Helix-turn-helix domain-containing protein n=1 Tax=Streptomyces bauhiniae TaxID=2340725 RepID=A0A7K3QLK6_9ACTN|nr:helix-turn-helix domain-containing protein [Streptomyces bauhiniae]NEB90763.1 helix-turn-helix domain-containing protein [Streptomyces bauhiniae]
MYDMGTRERALALMAQNRSLNSVSREIGISRAAIRSWRIRSIPLRTIDCPRCQAVPEPPRNPTAYAYLLGLYLGDGCVSPLQRGVHSLRIACAEAWPGLIDACAEAMRSVMPGNKVCQVRQQGCRQVTSYSKHWPCLIPQHGPGKKHERPIALEPWQQDIVDAHPWAFVRGLIHSDGCRVTNWTTRTVDNEPRRYEYPRYFFTNRSDDIRGLFTAALDRVGVEWKRANAQNISVARKASVALMDLHVGAKY